MTPKLSEKALQQQSRHVLAGLGYASMETGASRQLVTCDCGRKFTPTGWQGNSVGLPDLAVFRYGCFPSVGILLELKTATGKLSPAQQALFDAGRTQVARSVGDTVRAVLTAEIALNDYRFDRERWALLDRFLKENEGRI